MTTTPNSITPPRTSLLPALLTGGFLAGTFDFIAAVHAFGWKMPYGIASGLLGASANPKNGAGPSVWLLGVAAHFLIALSAAAAYCYSSRRLTSLKDHFLVGGVMCGIAVFLVMNLIVLPLSAVPFPVGPFTVQSLRSGLFSHIYLVGLPISASLWFFSRRAKRAAVTAT